MIKKVKVSELCPDMFIHDLNCPWLKHPFLHNRFKLKAADIDRISEYGITQVFIDTELGADVDDGPNLLQQQQVSEKKFADLASSLKRGAMRTTAFGEELTQAKRIHREASTIVQTTLSDFRLGKQVQLEKLQPVVSAVTESIFRNSDAMLSLLRIKQADNYTFQHSVAVGALLISFCRALEIDRTHVEQAGLGGFLHDIGKMKIPMAILNKPGKLSEDEYDIIKSHVIEGCLLIEGIPDISPISLSISAEHHEHFDGSGYPKHLKANEISRFGQIAAIVDVYDALTSNRIYHVGQEPTAVLKRLLESGGQQFDQHLVQQFIRVIGIYPTGTLVRLESGMLAVVLEQHHDNLLHPIVRIIFNSHSHSYITPKNYDLSKPGASDRIISFENPMRWQIDPRRFI